MELNNIKDILNTWQFSIIAFLLVSTVFTQYYKLAVAGGKKDGISLIILQLIGGLSILFLVPFFPIKFSTDPKIYGLLFVAIIFYTINDRMQVTVRKHLDVSIYSILNQLPKIFLILYGILVFKQEVVPSKLFGGFLIFFATAVLFYKKGKLDFSKYVTLAVLASFFVATGIIIDVDISSEFNLPVYIMMTLAIPAMIIFAGEGFPAKDVYLELMSPRKKYYVVTGLSWGFLILFMIRSLQLGEAIFIAPLLAVSVFLNVITAYFLHKEKSDFWKKTVVAIVIILGIYFTVA